MRNLDASTFTDDIIGQQSHRLRLLWIGLILAMADDQGRMEDKPIMMKLAVFPFDTKVTVNDIEADLKLLAKKNRIIRYTKDGRRLVQIVNWWKYQRNAQWASRSLYPPPAKWTDRIRCHERGHGTAVVIANWDHIGGLNSKKLPSRLGSPLPSRKVEPSKPLASREDEDEDEDNEKEEQASKAPPKKETTPKPAHAMPAASQNAHADADPTPDQIAAQEWMRPVLTALGIKNKRLEETLPKVTTRNYNGTLKHHVLGTIATVYADKRKANKPIIVALRLENHEEPLPEYLKPETWTVIPKHILEAAGIDNLEEMFTRPELKPFKPQEEEAQYVPMPEEVREKLKSLAKSKGRK